MVSLSNHRNIKFKFILVDIIIINQISFRHVHILRKSNEYRTLINEQQNFKTMKSVFLSFFLLHFLIEDCNSAFAQKSVYSNRMERETLRIQCLLPEHPRNGKWDVVDGETKTGDKIDKYSVLKFECSDGYILTSDSPYVMCDEKWNSDDLPKCEKMCPPLLSTSSITLRCRNRHGKKIECNKATHGTTLSYDCRPYYEVPLDNINRLPMVCINGIWSSSSPVCQPVCGKKVDTKKFTPLIWGGNEVTDIIYPWVIALYKKENYTYENICGGSLISRNLVLTAAHCVVDQYVNVIDSDQFFVAGGKKYNDYGNINDSCTAQYIKVEKIVIHERYRGDDGRFFADIAVLVTEKPFKLGPAVQPVCIKNVKLIYLPSGELGEVAGWGLTEENGPARTLRYIKVPFKDAYTCISQFESNWESRYNFVDKICAGYFQKNSSVCTGDSGNGLVFNNPIDNRFYVHGVVSIAPTNLKFTCNTQENALYASTAFYSEFIENQLDIFSKDEHTFPKYPNYGKLERNNIFFKNFVSDQCLLPSYPQFGKWEVLDVDEEKKIGDRIEKYSVLKFECADGYLLTLDSPYVMCDEKWNPDDLPKCEKMCPPLVSTTSTTLRCTNRHGKEIGCKKATHGTTLTYDCRAYYEVPLANRIPTVCINGVWSSPTPVCQPICGNKAITKFTPLIWGGDEVADIGVYPWVIAVYLKKKDNYQYICGGSLISRNLVLTAAHCVTYESHSLIVTRQSHSLIVAGGKKYSEYGNIQDSSTAQYIKVEKIVIHERYRGSNGRYFADIAVLVTEKLFKLGPAVQPVCVKNVNLIYLPSGELGEVAGWGVTENNDGLAKTLKYLKVPYKDADTCVRQMPSDWESTYNSLDKICAGYIGKNTSICRGDSGNGLVFNNPTDNRFYVHGVLSIARPTFDFTCNTQESALYSSTAFYSEFIEHQLDKFFKDECRLPNYPEFGKWEIKNDTVKKPGEMVLSETVLKFSCQPGHKLSIYPPLLECNKSYDLPTCNLMCKDPVFLPNTTKFCKNKKGQDINCEDLIHEDTIIFTCPEGYISPRGTPSAIYHCFHGSWGRENPHCVNKVSKIPIRGTLPQPLK